MIEQVIAGVVGGLCGWVICFAFMTCAIMYATKNKFKIENPTPIYIMSSITGAYLFIQWFC